jgi:enamine deaminase RidA (YjgF/YER057c/UK114 family)
VSPEEKLRALQIEIPAPPKPVAAYVPGVLAGDFVYTSGQLPVAGGEIQYRGKLGRELSVEEGWRAARLCALNCLGVLKDLAGSLDRVERIVKVTGFVACAGGFTQQPAVVNGASELLGEIFGPAGSHARSAVGVAELPLGAPVEIELIALLKKESGVSSQESE